MKHFTLFHTWHPHRWHCQYLDIRASNMDTSNCYHTLSILSYQNWWLQSKIKCEANIQYLLSSLLVLLCCPWDNSGSIRYRIHPPTYCKLLHRFSTLGPTRSVSILQRYNFMSLCYAEASLHCYVYIHKTSRSVLYSKRGVRMHSSGKVQSTAVWQLADWSCIAAAGDDARATLRAPWGEERDSAELAWRAPRLLTALKWSNT